MSERATRRRSAAGGTQRFHTRLVSGSKAPYDTWTFVVLPADVVEALGPPPVNVRGTLAGHPFRSSASGGEGVVRFPVTAEVRRIAGVARGDDVAVEIERDPHPVGVDVPAELQALLAGDLELTASWERLAPSHRRAWAQHIGEAKRPETRVRRLSKAAEGIRSRQFPR